MAHGEDSYLRQNQEQNPMDHENEVEESPQKERVHFENQMRGRQSITGEDLLDDDLPGPAYQNNQPNLNLLM
jgi:hypothetical protein